MTNDRVVDEQGNDIPESLREAMKEAVDETMIEAINIKGEFFLAAQENGRGVQITIKGKVFDKPFVRDLFENHDDLREEMNKECQEHITEMMSQIGNEIGNVFIPALRERAHEAQIFMNGEFDIQN